MLTPTERHPYLVTFMADKYGPPSGQQHWVYQDHSGAIAWASELNKAHSPNGGIATVYTACLNLPGQPYWASPEIPNYTPGEDNHVG
jgi:hypothetical protein